MDNDINMLLFEMQANICKSLSDSNRILVIHLLRDGEKSVNTLAAELKISQPNMSRHLAILRDSDLVNTRREGSTVYYSLRSPKIAEACDLVRSILSEQLERNRELASSLRNS